MNNPTPQPVWFFRFFAAYTAIMVVLLGVLYVDFFSQPLAADPQWGSVGYRLFIGLMVVPGGVVISALVLQRAPRNVTGLFLLMYAVAVMQSTLRVTSPLQPLSGLFNSPWIGIWLLPLYFPDGSVYPLRFQRWIRAHSVVTSIFFIGGAFYMRTAEIATGPGQISLIANPMMIPAIRPVAEIAELVQGVFWISTVLLIIPSIILRFRASRGLVRQQIKWFVWVFTILITLFLIMLPTESFDLEQYGVFSGAVFVLRLFIFPAAPFVAVGIAILRYRLYDIDIIIRRTLIYSILTAILALIYFGGVILTQQAFRAATGETPDIAIVLTTLLIAALFTPLRRRIQNTIDRRLYRRKYDVEQTLAHFNQALRDEVDIETLKAQLTGVVQETMQPTKVALWVRSTSGE